MHGVSTPAQSMISSTLLGSASGIKKSEVSRIYAGLDDVVGAFRPRRLDHIEFPYVDLDATYLHVRNATGQVTSMAVVIATGICATGEREVLGVDVGDSEDEAFCRASSRALLKTCGLGGVRLVISDQHSGLVAALRRRVSRCQPPAMPRALRPQPSGPRPQARTRTWSPPCLHHLRPTRPRHRRRHVGSSPRPGRRPVPQDRPTDGQRQSRGPRLQRLPAWTLDEDLVDEPARAARQRSQTASSAPLASSPTKHPSSVSSALSSPTSTTSGKPATAATSPKLLDGDPLPRARTARHRRRNSHPANYTEDHLEAHHSAGRSRARSSERVPNVSTESRASGSFGATRCPVSAAETTHSEGCPGIGEMPLAPSTPLAIASTAELRAFGMLTCAASSSACRRWRC